MVIYSKITKMLDFSTKTLNIRLKTGVLTAMMKVILFIYT